MVCKETKMDIFLNFQKGEKSILNSQKPQIHLEVSISSFSVYDLIP